ncbi:MAG TPA: D-glycero-beta-D-manno-heptose 1,7-bisphosphate 7-phosphatase, partial [Roseiflexaceae bacterium]|nr:D-glycero-beta-D-manno-heptose 1,7-bisphosphate 7-phosphatase [Roseiflexaceae bacterium]
MARPAIFLDRDGVINENRSDYVKSWEEVIFLPGAIEAIRRLNTSEYAIVMVTNQSAVGRGIVPFELAQAINRQVVEQITAAGGRVDAWYMCPHHPQQGCECRKPAPGLLLQAQRDLSLDLARSYMIGDAYSDLQAAQAAGVRATLVLTGRGA